MSSGFATPITIKNAIDEIVRRSYLLPAIQRKFVWGADKVEVLFDSIMRGYPINSFMFWEIKDDHIKNNFKFYQFLTEYRSFFKEDNPDIDTKGYNDFVAVIDGQQRLTSIYLGLKGSYAYKMPRKWWVDNEDSLPTRYLYLDINKPLPDENERQMHYDFLFLTDEEIRKDEQDPNRNWFKVNDILKFEDSNKLDDFIDEQTWRNNKFSKETIRKLRKVIFEDKLINYYLEKTQEIDIVLDIFIRTNSGGEPLNFSDLLMSITTANWTLDARKEIPDVVNKVFAIGSPNFLINKDFVLKTCLVLFSDNIKFQVKNFNQAQVVEFEKNWERVKKSIIESFNLLASWGFNNSSVRAKNAVIPIIYYIYHKQLENDINNKAKYQDVKQEMRKWLCLSLLKGVFGGQSDAVLTNIRKVLVANSQLSIFPLKQIKDEFKTNPSKNLSFDDDFIEGLLTIQKDDANCYPVLSLLYYHLNFEIQSFHKDHLHPQDYFRKCKQSDFETEDEYKFYKDQLNWNSILNLQLLSGSLNQSKLATPLVDWVNDKHIDKDNQLIPSNISLDIREFKVFIDERRKLLKQKFKEITD
jgi:uncharacterized protein with ParB-like and HNH nuclease domain